jgi:hypothetical protein
MSLDGSTVKGLFGTFGSLNTSRSSISQGFWNQRLAQTPPPHNISRAESSAMSEDMSMDSPTMSASNGPAITTEIMSLGCASRASTPQSMFPPTAAEGLKKSNKRRRDDDLDEHSLKRRAVSPGLSVHNSPVISQSPVQRDGQWSATNKAGGHSSGERSNSGGSTSMSMTPTFGPKRVGLQGMTDTSDGLMKMSIE